MHHRTVALRAAVSATALTALFAVTACSSDEPAAPHHGGGTGATEQSGEFNDADVMFAQMMIPHHEQAVTMSALAADRAQDEEILELADAIAGAQQPEIDTMTQWLTDWGQSTEVPAGHESMMSGMLSEEDMAELEAAEGTAFDRLFAEHMIAHHQGAVEMATEERDNGADPDAVALAEAVIEAQTAEIEQLQGILDRL